MRSRSRRDLLGRQHRLRPFREFSHVRSIAAHGVDEIVPVGSLRDPAVIQFLRAKSVPYVVTWTFADAEMPSVGFDNSEAARRLAA